MRLSAVKIIARVHFRGITAACVSITGEIIELRGAAMIFCSSGLTSAGTGRVFAGTSNVCHCRPVRAVLQNSLDRNAATAIRAKPRRQNREHSIAFVVSRDGDRHSRGKPSMSPTPELC
ncbi:MAG TPA: hypothetical protein VN325_03490 [Steroidobacteraceae bacterium]|nr:hypothetical protein [Steroidobacteraceae bacterium]